MVILWVPRGGALFLPFVGDLGAGFLVGDSGFVVPFFLGVEMEEDPTGFDLDGVADPEPDPDPDPEADADKNGLDLDCGDSSVSSFGFLIVGFTSSSTISEDSDRSLFKDDA